MPDEKVAKKLAKDAGAFINKNNEFKLSYVPPAKGEKYGSVYAGKAYAKVAGAENFKVVFDEASEVHLLTATSGKPNPATVKALNLLMKSAGHSKIKFSGNDSSSAGAQSASSPSESKNRGDTSNPDDAKIKNALLKRFAAWRTTPTSDKLSDTEMKLMNGFNAAIKSGTYKSAAACLDGLEKIANKTRKEVQTGEGTYSKPPPPGGGDDTYMKPPPPGGGDDTYMKPPPPGGGDDTYMKPPPPGGGDDTYMKPPPPSGGDDSKRPLRDDEDDFEVDEKVRNQLIRQFGDVQDRFKTAASNVGNSLHADKNRKSLQQIKAALEKVRASLKKKQFVPITVGETLRAIDNALKKIEAETGTS